MAPEGVSALLLFVVLLEASRNKVWVWPALHCHQIKPFVPPTTLDCSQNLQRSGGSCVDDSGRLKLDFGGDETVELQAEHRPAALQWLEFLEAFHYVLCAAAASQPLLAHPAAGLWPLPASLSASSPRPSPPTTPLGGRGSGRKHAAVSWTSAGELHYTWVGGSGSGSSFESASSLGGSASGSRFAVR